jgi:hypothetical protein
MAPVSKKQQGAATSKKVAVVKTSPVTKKEKKSLEYAAHKAARYRRALDALDDQPIYEGVYTASLGDFLFWLIVDGSTLRQIADLPGDRTPTYKDLLLWSSDPVHPFYKLRERASKAKEIHFEEESIRNAADPLIGIKTVRRQVVTKDGYVVDVVDEHEFDNIERAKLRQHALEWTLAFTNPKKYGRAPDVKDDKGNEQLEALFDSLKVGPAE